MTDRLRSRRDYHGLRSFPTTALIYLLVWMAIAAIAAMVAFIALRSTTIAEWLSVFVIMLEYFYAWGAIVLGVYWLQNSTPTRWSLMRVQIPLHLLLLALILVVMPVLVHGEDWRAWLYGDRAAGFQALNVLMYSLALVSTKMFHHYRIAKIQEAMLFEAELERVELEKAAESSRMDALRAQINPHFLFNTLNSVAALIESSSNREAYDVVARLAELLRHSFDYSRDKLVTLGEELRFLDTYLEIEQIRFGPRLRVSKSIPEAYLGMEVPSFSLQPLVENAIKHAVAKTSQTVCIDILATRSDGMLTLAVADDGPGPGPGAEFGVGLGNVRSRIEHLYGKRATLELAPGERAGAVATLKLPCQAAAGAASTSSAKPSSHSKESPPAPLAGQLE